MKLSLEFSILAFLLIVIAVLTALDYHETRQDKICPECVCPDLQPAVDSLTNELNELKSDCEAWKHKSAQFDEVMRIEKRIKR